MRLAAAVALGVSILAIGCGDRSPPAPPAGSSAPPAGSSAPPAGSSAPPVRRVDASALLQKYECNRCHDVPGLAAAPRDKHCVLCHQQIHDGTFAAEPAALARWRGRITSLRWAPSLAGADRLRRAWLRDFLLAPHDVRPGLVAEMPRLAISRADAEQIAAHLVPEPGDGELAAASDDVARGEQLYRGLGCARCHRFTGAAVDDVAMHAAGRDQMKPVDPTGGSAALTAGSTAPMAGSAAHQSASLASDAWALAPDLRHARTRIRPGQLAASIAAPRGAMPRLGISPDDARRLAAFIATTPLAALPAPAAVTRPPRLARAVTWDEVERRVFRHVCWHCHAVPDYARGDGGPGNSGGFGFPPRGLDVSSYAGISSGSLDDAGEPRSVFAPLPDGTPRIIAHLLARHAEQAGRVVDGVRGMPLGLPPLPLEDIQLVDTWIAQGRPR